MDKNIADDKISSFRDIAKEPTMTDEEIDALDEQIIIDDHDRELEALEELAFVQECATEHNQQGTFEQLKNHAQSKVCTPNKTNASSIDEVKDNGYYSNYYHDYYTR